MKVNNKYIMVAMMMMVMSSSVNAMTRFCNGIWKPSPGMSWMWQIGTTPSQSVISSSNAQVVDLDMYNTPVSLIDFVHAKGKAMICYIDTQYEPNRPDSKLFTSNLLGGAIDGWPGQFWVDIRSPIVKNIMLGRAQLAQSKGCDAIEWDDVDGYANTNGFGLTYQDQITFNTYLANMTHSLGMSVGLKNDLDQVDDLVNYFDWALNEQCFQYNECDSLLPFITAGKAVFGTEYQGTPATFCPVQNTAGYSWLLSDLNLDGKGTTQCCSYETPSCPSVSYQCTPSIITLPTLSPAADTSPSGESGSVVVSSISSAVFVSLVAIYMLVVA